MDFRPNLLTRQRLGGKIAVYFLNPVTVMEQEKLRDNLNGLYKNGSTLLNKNK